MIQINTYFLIYYHLKKMNEESYNNFSNIFTEKNNFSLTELIKNQKS